MSDELTGVLWTAGGLVVVAILGIIGNVLVKRYRNRASEPEMWKELRKLQVTVYGGFDDESQREIVGLTEQLSDVRRRNAAAGRVIRALSRQWPENHVPRLDPDDILELEDTIPAHWKVKPSGV